MNIRRFVLMALTLASTAACSDPLAPTSVAGQFVDPSFYKFVARTDNLVLEGLSASITVDPDGRLTLRTMHRETNVDTQESVIRESETLFTYVIEGARLRTSMPPCPEGMACPAVLIDTPDFLIVGGGDGLLALDGRRGRYARVTMMPE